MEFCLLPGYDSMQSNPSLLPMRTGDLKKPIGELLLGPICFCILCGILYAGLTPFTTHFPNEVRWSESPNGLRFGPRGMIRASGSIQWTGAEDRGPCTLEIWLQPIRIWQSGTILAFYTPEYAISFSVSQWMDSILLMHGMPGAASKVTTERMAADHVLREGQPSLITITSDGRRAEILANGILAEPPRNFPLIGHDLTAQFIVGNSPLADDSWSGLLQGLAFYDRQLTAQQIRDHSDAWTRQGQPGSSATDGLLALYLFKENGGKLIHSEIATGPNLSIPDYYQILHAKFLSPPWADFSLDRSYVQDVLVNIAGFIPVGFFFCAYFSVKRRIRHPALTTILIGAALSLTIEILQSYIPVRDSSTTDVITNTLGTILGVMLYGWEPCKALLYKLTGIPATSSGAPAPN